MPRFTDLLSGSLAGVPSGARGGWAVTVERVTLVKSEVLYGWMKGESVVWSMCVWIWPQARNF